MKKPEMILFDYGNTLLCEPDLDFLRAQRAVFRHVTANKYNMTPEQVTEFMLEIYYDKGHPRSLGFEMQEHQFLRFVYEYLCIDLDITYPEVERVFWTAATPGGIMPGVDKLLEYLEKSGIRTGVISNIGWSHDAMKERIDRLLPDNRFEFVITSGDYLYCKPHKRIFELALRKADLQPPDVWYCGDNVRIDIDGAGAAGLYPVWYENTHIINPWKQDKSRPLPEHEHIHINEWHELIPILEECE
ncbi:MAG: HAD family hydrolase [Clostridiales bacterium]|nr:HAD family hydrolase [Clostridiales bacterium]